MTAERGLGRDREYQLRAFITSRHFLEKEIEKVPLPNMSSRERLRAAELTLLRERLTVYKSTV